MPPEFRKYAFAPLVAWGIFDVMTLYAASDKSRTRVKTGFNARVRNRRGFTLVEILVVTAIIAILAAVSFSGFSSALIRANRTKCALNLKAIGVGMIAYAGDNNQNLPMSGGTIPYGSVDVAPPMGSGLASWTQQLDPYLGTALNNPVYVCPDSSKKFAVNAQFSYFNGSRAAYAANGGAFAAVNLLRVQNLSVYIMAGDNSFGMFTANDADKDDYTQDPAFNSGTPTTPVIIPIHGGFTNILFGDGHVESLKTFDNSMYTTVYNGLGYKFLGP